jgi:hypothetical protein
MGTVNEDDVALVCVQTPLTAPFCPGKDRHLICEGLD